ncbi:10215_t:CDS:2 [Paraglomus occultum]|uniref:10215_t:CDS:1 n=1 Tax=Paraglomus occultum TaxID=144539 RepID=A0A9N9AFQ3_9GLOM|nr:10215_t:CDS:2 [Paraglomus occultum]
MVKLLIDRPCTFAPASSTSFPQDTNMNNIVLIELQGELEKYGAEEWKDLYVGRIRFEEGVPILYVDHNRIEGKLVELKSPHCIIVKRTHYPFPSSQNQSKSELQDVEMTDYLDAGVVANSRTDEGGELSAKTKIEYCTVSLIWKKYVFAKRPLPMMEAKWKEALNIR